MLEQEGDAEPHEQKTRRNTELDKRILELAKQNNSLPEIAEATGFRYNTLVHYIGRMLKAGIIVPPLIRAKYRGHKRTQ